MRHISDKANVDRYRCIHCLKAEYLLENLWKHNGTHHRKQDHTGYHCNKHHYLTSNNQLACLTRPYVCYICGVHLLTADALSRHSVTHRHSDYDSPFDSTPNNARVKRIVT